MATSTSQKAPCAICGKVAGLFTCRGCQKDFCTRHVVEHRQELGREMDELTMVHDQFRQSLTEQTTKSYQISCMKQIDEWEQQSINKIHREAADARKQLQDTIDERTTKLTEVLAKIARELQKAREDDDFFETDLTEWTEKLNKLKKDLAQPPNIDIGQNDTVIASIPKMVVLASKKEIFERLIGNIRIEDDGQVIVKDQPNSYATVRGNGEYTSGQHRFRFKTEEYHTGKWVFIGIVSKDVPMIENSCFSQSSCGWTGDNAVYLNGACWLGYNNYKSDTQKNDIVELFIDCDLRIIRLKNERTQSVHTLQIDINLCRFPWQLNCILYYSNDRLRILQT
jgi:hypothetical protein